MEISLINGIDYDSNVYVISGIVPTVIDCGTGLNYNYIQNKIEEILNPKKIKQIIFTHEHFDHVGGIKKLIEFCKNNPKIFAHFKASEKIEKGESEFAKMLGLTMPKMPIDIKLSGGEELTIGNEKFIVIYSPGHSLGSICLYCKENKTLFSGDTIFAYGSFGRYDFPGGNLIQLKNSIKNLSKLEVENLYPGHDVIIKKDAKKHILKSLENIENIYD